MSVINKMLRDLDQRQASLPGGVTAPADAGSARAPGGGSPRGASSRSPSKPKKPWLALVGLALVVLGFGSAAWWWQSRSGEVGTASATRVSEPVSVVSAPQPASAVPPAVAPAAAPASAPTPQAVVAAAAASQPVPQASAPLIAPVKSEPQNATAARSVRPPLSTTTSPPPASLATGANFSLRMETALASRGLAEPASAPRNPVVAPERSRSASAPGSASGAGTPSSPAQDALLQAQTLWNAGSRDAAVELLRDAVSIAERGAAGSAVLLPLARELTRMQLAEGHFSAVWDLLTRLEPHLANQADLWAIRANAAQRLGRHQDSVHAYMTALQVRPTEQRWLLGAAVSLAALGQTNSAAEMADKARAAGPISKDVQAYLRQLNVPLRD